MSTFVDYQIAWWMRQLIWQATGWGFLMVVVVMETLDLSLPGRSTFGPLIGSTPSSTALGIIFLSVVMGLLGVHLGYLAAAANVVRRQVVSILEDGESSDDG